MCDGFEATISRGSARLKALLTATLAGGLLFAVPLAARTRLLENIPLQWKPTTTTAELGLPPLDLTRFDGVTVVVSPFVDNQPDPQKIGENREEEKDPAKPVTTSDNVGQFLAERTEDFIRDLGLSVSRTGGTSVVAAEVVRFFVAETQTYEADVKLKVSIYAPDGKVRWSGMAVGSAKRFGRSYKAENYYEVLSDAFLDAMAHVFRQEAVVAALAMKGPVIPVATAAARPEAAATKQAAMRATQTPQPASLPASPAMASAADQCRAHFTKEGSFFKGATYRTYADFGGLGRDAVFVSAGQSLAGDGWQIVNTNKDMGLISASQQVIAPDSSKSVPLNVTVKEAAGGTVRVEMTFAVAPLLKAKDDAVREDFCKVLSKIAP